ncbi:MAG TPA: hypothetical protein VM011_05750 [Gammaproteobacteria bacterium]|nr:hypothetical protein [Gammaproteobacteria bacterium]
MMRGKTLVLVVLGLSALIAGLLDPLFGVPDSGYMWFNLALSLFCAILVFTWYYLDSDEHTYRRTPLLNAMVVAAGVFAIPWYLFRSRGARRGLRAFGLFLLASLAWLVLAAAGMEIGERLLG